MTRGATIQSKIHYKGESEDFLVFVDDVDTYKKWLADKSVPLAHFVSAFNVFVTHQKGSQGQYDKAAKGPLESEFGTSVTDDVIKQILEKGTLQESRMDEREGPRNVANGAMIPH